MPPPPTVITLTTDFGLEDSYVAEMKAVLLRHRPDARLIDVTHQIPPQDVLAGSVVLERVVRSFPAALAPQRSFHLAVVDPGVGTDRRLLAVSFDGATVVCPDNGLITWPWRRHRGAAHKVVWRPDGRASHTFHGRDVLAPVVGMLAAGRPVGELCEPIADPVLLDVHLADARVTGQVIHVDRFGNATTNIPEELLRGRPSVTVRVGSQTVGPVRRTYADAAAGRPLVLIGSSGLLEIAVRDGSAARVLGLRAGDEVFFE